MLKSIIIVLAIPIMAIVLLVVRAEVIEYQITKPRTPTPTIPFPTLSQRDLWNNIQFWRRYNHLPEYTEEAFVCEVADKRIKEIKTDFSHDKFNNENIVCPTKPCTIAENLSDGYIDSQAVLNRWLDSPPHRKALEKDFKYSCIRTDGNTAIQVFGNY